MKPSLGNSISRVFFGFAPMGQVGEMRFERNWTTLVNPPFFAACKSPPKMVALNRNCKIRFQGFFFVSPRYRKSKKRVLNAIGRPSSTWLFALLGKTQPKWCYKTVFVEFDPKCVFSFCPDGESQKNAFWTRVDDLRQTAFLGCLEKPTQNCGMKPTSCNSIPRVFSRFAPMRKLEKTRFERDWTTFVNPPFCAAWKSPPKMVVWNRPRGIFSQLCLSLLPRWRKPKKSVFNAIGLPLSTRFFALLGKAHPKGRYETDLAEFDPGCALSLCPDGESQKTRFKRDGTTFINTPFGTALKSPPKMVISKRPRAFRSQVFFFVLPRWGMSKKCVLNAIRRPWSTRLFEVLWKRNPKWRFETDLAVFDPKCAIFVSPWWGKSKNAF